MAVSFTLEKRTNLHNECPIRLSWSFCGQRYQSSLGFSVKKEDWDENNKLVKANARNHFGQSAEDINYLIKRISAVVSGVEQNCIGSKLILSKDMMKHAISDAKAKDIARPEDIVERCINGIVSTPEPRTQYYRDNDGKYYQFICIAQEYYYSHNRHYILKELFGGRKSIAISTDDFKPKRENGNRNPSSPFTEVSKEEVFGR